MKISKREGGWKREVGDWARVEKLRRGLLSRVAGPLEQENFNQRQNRKILAAKS